MKKVIQILAIVITAFIIQSFIPTTHAIKKSTVSKNKVTSKKSVYERYGFCIGREQAKAGGKNQPVVTNVFKFTCGDEQYPKEYIIEGQFNTYYESFFKSNRNTMYMKDKLKFMYNSYSEAEKGRREYVAKYVNNGDDPLLITKFFVLCDD